MRATGVPPFVALPLDWIIVGLFVDRREAEQPFDDSRSGSFSRVAKNARHV